MTNKIEKLTPEQWEACAKYADKLRDYALDVSRCDGDKAKEAVRKLYAATSPDDKAPHVFYFDSPLQCFYARSMLKVHVNGHEGDNTDPEAVMSFWENCKDEEFKAMFEGADIQAIANKVDIDDLFQTIWFIGNWDWYWVGLYDFARQIGVKYDDKENSMLDAYIQYILSAGPALMYDEVAFISDRASKIELDAERRLHCGTGPALQWTDGFGVYSWKGVRLPKKIAETTDPKEILKVANQEHKRCLIERYSELHGIDAFMTDLGAKVVAEDKSLDLPRRLVQIDDQKFVHVINGTVEADGTRREFMLSVADEVETPHEAIAESYGFTPQAFEEAVRA